MNTMEIPNRLKRSLDHSSYRPLPSDLLDDKNVSAKVARLAIRKLQLGKERYLTLERNQARKTRSRGVLRIIVGRMPHPGACQPNILKDEIELP